MANEEDPRKPANSTMKRLNDVETEMLISFVQEKPCLWNESHADFKNTALRKKLWNLVGWRLSMTGDEAKCKWKNLKDKFRKLRNIQEVKSGSGMTPAAPKWKFYNAMLFTKDVLISDGNYTSPNSTPTVKSVSWLSDDSTSVTSDVPEDTEDNNILTGKTQNRESLSSTLPVSQGKRNRSLRTCSRGTKKRKSNNDDSGKILQLEEKRSASSSMTHEDKKGDDYHFLMSLLPYIEALDPLEKLELRAGAQTLVTDSYKKHVSKKGFKFRQPVGNQSEY